MDWSGCGSEEQVCNWELVHLSLKHAAVCGIFVSQLEQRVDDKGYRMGHRGYSTGLEGRLRL